MAKHFIVPSEYRADLQLKHQKIIVSSYYILLEFSHKNMTKILVFISLFIARLMQRGTLTGNNCNTEISSKRLPKFLHLTLKLSAMRKTDVQFGEIILEHSACNNFFHSSIRTMYII